jgi:WD40 repeat protein
LNSLAWSPDGRRLATANDDGTLRIWNVGDLTMQRVIVPTAPLRVTVLDRSGQVIQATSGAMRDLVAYQVSPRGAVILMTLAELPKKKANTKSRGAARLKKGTASD